jgi:hypothetical protein
MKVVGNGVVSMTLDHLWRQLQAEQAEVNWLNPN